MKDKRDRTEYRKKFWKENKERLKPKHREYWIKYSKMNRDKLKEKARKYYRENRDKIKAYYEKNKIKMSQRHKKYYQKNREKIRTKYNKYYNKKYEENMLSWIGYIPEKTICQICGINIYLGKKNKSNAIHFDHRENGNETIKNTPSSWLYRNKRTLKNEAIWKSCNFGMLCFKCNIQLPTKNRKEYIKKVYKYVFEC